LQPLAVITTVPGQEGYDQGGKDVEAAEDGNYGQKRDNGCTRKQPTHLGLNNSR